MKGIHHAQIKYYRCEEHGKFFWLATVGDRRSKLCPYCFKTCNPINLEEDKNEATRLIQL
jgi:hypothetical protein